MTTTTRAPAAARASTAPRVDRAARASSASAPRHHRAIGAAHRASSRRRPGGPSVVALAALPRGAAAAMAMAMATRADADAASARPRDGVVARGRKGMLGRVIDGEDDETTSKKKKEKRAAAAADKAATFDGAGRAPKGSASMAASLEGGLGKASSKGKNWIVVGDAKTDFASKPIKLLELANGNFLLVKYAETDQVFCIPCNSTAYQYPMIDGELFFGPAGPAIRVPLDGTEYDLTTGDVIKARSLFYTLVPIRPRSRGERRSLRTFSPGASLRPSPLAFDPDTPRCCLSTPSDAFELHPDVHSLVRDALKWCPGGGNPIKSVLGALKSKETPVPLPTYPVSVAADGTISTTFVK